MIQYSREVPNDAPEFVRAMVDTVDHVRGHLSACVDPDDSEDARAGDVEIVYTTVDGGTLVTGVIHAEPDAPYLRDDFDPDADDEYVFTRYSEAGRDLVDGTAVSGITFAGPESFFSDDPEVSE